MPPHGKVISSPTPCLWSTTAKFVRQWFAIRVNSSEMELMQYRSPVGGGPSGKTCP